MEQLTPDMMVVLAVLAGAIALFVTEVVRIDVAAIIILVTVGILGLVDPNALFAGFSSNAVISIIAVMILGAGLDRVGIMNSVAAFLLKIGGRTERRILALISGTVAVISGFMQNIGAAALFLPVTERLAERTSIPVSRLLMPMGFAAILGGTMTLVGSGPLILLNDLLANSMRNLGLEYEPFNLFAPTPIGLALVVSSIAMFAIFGRWLLPSVDKTGRERPSMPQLSERYGLQNEVQAWRVSDVSPLLGQTVQDIEADNPGLLLSATVDQDGLNLAPARDVVIRKNMVLGLTGPASDRKAFFAENSLVQDETDPFAILRNDELAGLAEIVVRPGSDAIGKRVRDFEFRKINGITLLGIHRNGAMIEGDLRFQTLAAGDVLVFFARWQRLTALLENPAFVAISDYPREQPRTGKKWWAIGAFAVALTLVLFSSFKLSLALMVGAAILLVSRVLSPDEAYRAVSWKTVFLLAALIPLGQAVEQSGTAAWIASQVISAVEGMPVWAIQLAIALLTTAFTLTVSNVGATVLLIPLAVNVAVGVDADPAQFAMIVAIAASNAFFLPTHQVNALLMGPGGYRVKDFLKAGLASTVLFTIVLLVGVNLFL
ncbi:MAG: SLC13 family permease [Ectothiorhodospiraceae bacterium]|nr:SLC13 family permease [Ectothiorhodospiraceae bacterium]